MTADTMVATKVSTKQKEASSITEDAVRSSRLRGVSRRRENRLEITRLRTNLKKEKNQDSALLLIFQFLPVTEGSEASPSEEENDKDSIENDANEKGDANDDFQEHNNKKITIKTIMRNNQSFYRQDSQIHC